jgi:hypothetical protein
MCNNRILITAIVAVLGSFPGVNMADSSFVNVDYSLHADGTTCGAAAAILAGVIDVNGDGVLDGTGGEEVLSTPTFPILSALATTPTQGCAPNATLFDFSANTTVTPDEANGIIDSNHSAGKAYAVEITQSGVGTLPAGDDGLGTTTPKYKGVLYTTDGWINQKFELTYTLSDGTFAGEPLLAISNSDVPVGGTALTTYTPITGGWSRTSVGLGKNTVIFSVDPTTTTAATSGFPDGSLNHQSLILLLYQVKDATSLETAGGEVTMTAKLQTVELQAGQAVINDVNRPLEIFIATSTDSLSARMTDEGDGTIYISVNDNSKLFTDGTDNSAPATSDTPDAFRTSATARIGYLKVGGIDAFQPDGVNLFAVGSGLGKAGTASELVISGGQFDASVNSPGYVRLLDPATGTQITSVASTDGSTVTIPLDDTTLAAISNSASSKGVAIEFVLDLTTEVNLVETPPTATFNLVFDDENIVVGDELATSLTDVPMRQIFQDGIVCWAFNVPYATVQDRFNIRITNESAVAGALTVTMYEASGTEVTNAELTNESGMLSVLKSETELGTGTGTVQNLLPAGQTLHLNSEKLEAALGTSWTGRAVLRIVSELPEVEMLAMLRNQLMDDASQPLNNLSLGAQGISCTQGQ